MDENKICPIMSGEEDISCDPECCAWWDDITERCSVATIAFGMASLSFTAYDLFGDEEEEDESEEC